MIKVQIIERPSYMRKCLHNISKDTYTVYDEVELPCRPQIGDYIITKYTFVQVSNVILVHDKDYIIVVI